MGEEWDVMVGSRWGEEAPWDLEDCHVPPWLGILWLLIRNIS